MVKQILTAGWLLLLGVAVQAQLTTPPSGGNKKATVAERIGITDVTIHYDRPGVKGREGKIWGSLIPVGFTDQGFGTSKAAPWRAGANENTTMEFSTDVKIEGQPLAAGRYGFFVAYDPQECTLIFSRNSTSWGSFYYDPSEDVLRVKVRPVPLERSVEWLKYEFTDQTPTSATIALQWEKLQIPFRVEVDYVNTQLESFRRELRSDKGFTWESWDQAASWCLQHQVNLDQALLWADSATSPNFGGDRSFRAWSTKAMLLDKMGKPEQAAAIMKNALPYGSMFELHQYGRMLIQQKKAREALDVFKQNYARYPNQFTTLAGLVRGYSATGDYKTALRYAGQALPLAPDPLNRSGMQAMIDKLKQGQDVN
ncbi:MAG TPA: DUF2911 domain-containing protein [Chitinophagaceae bacterium]|nr:DUF2911 domain-containing protein [Chitinophagaceae bacterium]